MMKGIVIKWNWLFEKIFTKFEGLALFPFIFIRSGCDKKEVLKHERIHIKQQVKYLVVGFYVSYFVQLMYYYFKYKNMNKAYYSVSFEQEAYRGSYADFVRRFKEIISK